MKRRRVKITGIGPVTPAGIGRQDFIAGILQSVSRIRPFTKLGADFGPFVAGQVEHFQLKDYVPKQKMPKGAARHTEFAIAGTVLALRDAGVTDAMLGESTCAIVAGSSLMDFDGIGRTIEGVVTKGIRGAVPRTIYTTPGACISAAIAEILGISARTLSIQTSCCAGLDAIGNAARLIADGECEFAICGGTEAPLHRCPLVELRAAGLTPASSEDPKRLNRPFDLWRTTGVVSEGAAMLLLEAEDSPRPGYGFISGYGCASDGGSGLCAGMYDSIVEATANAGIHTTDVDVINAWGPGHQLIDAAESRVLRRLLGASLAEIPVFSIKGSVGNPLGAAGAIQVAATAISFQHRMLPPTVNWQFPDPDCPLNLSARSRALETRVSLINAHGLSGVNSALVLRK
ncbi:MAG TPA: beta-ketoacyl synthase N-terminal-like domain-containing protein [Opitutaceae bacterium]|nr:beta-ketoacyl synthase N-terminal-like domain-containing protein [Opitutaceae bacterium]